MKKQKVISRKNLPSRFPLLFFLVLYLCLDKWNVPQWVWGVAGTFSFLLIVAYIWMLFQEEQTDIFDK